MKKILFTILIFASLITFGQKALVVNSEITRTGIPTKFERHNGQIVWGGYQNLHDSIHYNDGWRDVVIPTYDAATQRLGARYYNGVADIVTYPVINKTAEELAVEKEAFLDMMDEDVNFIAVKRLLQIFAKPLLDSIATLPDLLPDLVAVYPQYRIGKAYATRDVFVKDSIIYEVIQAHTSQDDWLPETTASLYKQYRIPDAIAPFVQPTGAHDAYMKGEKVSFNGNNYESLIDNNVWSPVAYPQGWKIL